MLRPPTEPFSPFLKWEAHCEAPRTLPQAGAPLHTDTHTLAASLRQEEAGPGEPHAGGGITEAVKILSSRRWASSAGLSRTSGAAPAWRLNRR